MGRVVNWLKHEWWRPTFVLVGALLAVSFMFLVVLKPAWDETSFSYFLVVMFGKALQWIFIPIAIAWTIIHGQRTWRTMGRMLLIMNAFFVIGASLIGLMFLVILSPTEVLAFSNTWWRVVLGILLLPFMSLAIPLTWQILLIADAIAVGLVGLAKFLAKRSGQRLARDERYETH